MLQRIKENVLQLVANRKFTLILIISAILIAVALWVYTTYVAPKLQPSFVPNKEFIPQGTDVTTADLYFFCVDWCPHCKKAKPILEKIKKKYTENKINGVQVTFKFINGDKHEADIISFEKEHNVKIEGFPTIYLVKGEEVIEYDADPTEDTMTEFLHTTL
jgi:thiol-disulfide isomerase/thioredoxin